VSTSGQADVAQRMEHTLQRYFTACNTGDVEAVAALFAPGAVHDPPAGLRRPRQGRASCR
jgi:ketosteroid isomerase-like protein